LPEGDAYLGVRLSTGQMAYTRNGHLERGPNGELLASGLAVLGISGEPVTVPPGADPRIESNGNVGRWAATRWWTRWRFSRPGAHGQDRAHLASAFGWLQHEPDGGQHVRWVSWRWAT